MPEYTTVELNGDEYKIRFDLNAICVIEDELKIDFSALSDQELNGRNIRAILWAGLRKFHPGLSKEDVGDLIDVQNMAAITRQLNAAMGGDGRGNSSASAQNLASGTGPTPNVPATASSG